MSEHLYSVRALDADRPLTHRVEGESFEEAAMAFVELWHPAPDSAGEVAVMVTEAESGRQQCFRIDLGSGESRACDS